MSMKRKLVISMLAIMISIGLIACSSNNTDSADGVIVQESSSMLEKQSGDGVANLEISEEIDSEIENGEMEIYEEEKNVPTWYMDSEGVKNEELGVIIKKDNTDLEKLGLALKRI